MKYIPNIFKMPMSEWKINKNDDMLQETKEMIRNLIFHQLNKIDNKYPDNLGKNGIPKDIEENLNKFSLSTKEIRMHYDAMYNHRAYGFLSSLFMTPTRTFTKLDIITTLFPNINTLSMMRVPLTTLTFMYLKSIINPPKPANIEEEKDDHKDNGDDHNDNSIIQPLRCKISEFRLLDPKTAAMSIDAVIQAERKSLAQYQWTIDSPDQVSLVLKYSDIPVIIKEPTPPPVIEEKKEDETEKKEEEKKPVKRRMKRKKRPQGKGGQKGKPKTKPKPKPKPKPKAAADETTTAATTEETKPKTESSEQQ